VLAVGPAPPPVFHQSVVVKPVSGTVLVKRPGSRRFVRLVAGQVPLGSSVDATHGRLALSSVPAKDGAPQTVQLYSGQFKVSQPGKVTQFALNAPLASCGAKASAAKRKPRTRKLWGDGKGSFRISGRYSAATVRGTRWLVQDTCAGTLTRVVRGVVSVRDEVRRRTVTLRAGKRYLARPRH
jgi:ferric-dicitrate binding protein FerR (iron transport regulator)